MYKILSITHLCHNNCYKKEIQQPPVWNVVPVNALVSEIFFYFYFELLLDAPLLY